ncbi:transposase [Rhizobium sp. BIGb0125]|uniref:transposase n=1 Tax=Rhizobium sp. BIGb0125 TaxID=2940618 RepID=UPI0021677F49|nr:transposase [Rhizobium sp. BIGb0125]MCS4241392.1 transposase [Rhizobium sp. BIGb0125]
MARGDLNDEEWLIVERFLPTERGRKSRPSLDNRRFLNGMLYVLRIGCPWRDMHERYGNFRPLWQDPHILSGISDDRFTEDMADIYQRTRRRFGQFFG